MNKKRVWLLAVALIVVLSAVAGCASKSEEAAYPSYGDSAGTPEEAANDGKSAVEDQEKDTAGGTTNILIYGEDTDRRLIYTVTMQIETYTFETDYAKIVSDVSGLGGYVSNEYTYGTKPEKYGDSGRQSTLTVKIPIAKLEGFLSSLDQFEQVVSKNMQVQDTTDSYYDTETRISLLEEQYTKLEGYLKAAVTVEDMLSIQDKMSDILYQLDTLKGQIRNLDNLILYSTVTINLNERVRAENVATSSESLGKRIKEAFTSSIKGLGVFFEGFVIVFAGALPVLAILGAIAAIVVVIVKITLKYKKKKLQPKT